MWTIAISYVEHLKCPGLTVSTSDLSDAETCADGDPLPVRPYRAKL